MTEFEISAVILLIGILTAVCIFGALNMRDRDRDSKVVRKTEFLARLSLNELLRAKNARDRDGVL